MPQWLQDLLDSSDYVTPVLIAIIVVWLELRRRRRLARTDEGPDDPGPDDESDDVG